MSFCKLSHMPFRKLFPSFTLNFWRKRDFLWGITKLPNRNSCFASYNITIIVFCLWGLFIDKLIMICANAKGHSRGKCH